MYDQSCGRASRVASSSRCSWVSMIWTASTAAWIAGRADIGLSSFVRDFASGLGGAVQHLLHASYDCRFLAGADPDRLVPQDRFNELPRGARRRDVRVVDIDDLLLAVLIAVEGEWLQAQAGPRAKQPGAVRLVD